MRRPGVSGGIGVPHGPAKVSDLPREGVRRRGTRPPTPQGLALRAPPKGSGWTSWLRTWARDFPHLPQSPPSHPGRVPQPSGGPRALAMEPLDDILKTRVMLKSWLMRGSMWEAVGPGVQPLPYCPTALLPSRPTTVWRKNAPTLAVSNDLNTTLGSKPAKMEMELILLLPGRTTGR
jgi:hypothetical protein